MRNAHTSTSVRFVQSRALRVVIALVTGLAILVLLPAVAQAHVERPSYWPDPKPDCSISPCAGGKVPVARSLASALDDSLPGTTRVVCQSGSLTRLRSSIAKARTSGKPAKVIKVAAPK